MAYNYFAEVYDKLTDNVEYKKRADYICKLFEKYGVSSNASVIDLACGTGSLTLELAKRGYDMTGVDISYEMLMQAQQKKYGSGLDILFLCQDMTKLDLYGTVDAAVCTLDSLNHLESENDVKTAIEKVGLFMNPDGLFIFDVNTEYKHREILGNNTFVYDCDNVYCVWQNTLSDDNSVEINLDIFEENEDGTYVRNTECFSEYVYSVEKIKLWLKNAQFQTLEVFDEETLKEPQNETQRLIFVAKYEGKSEDKINE